LLYKINALQSLTEVTEFKIDFNTKLPQRQSFSWLTLAIRCITVMIMFSYTVVSVLLPMYVKCTKIFLHGSRTLVMIMICFKCLGSSCLDLGLAASAPDCLASVLPHLGLSCRCLASAFASQILPQYLPLPQKNALTTTLTIMCKISWPCEN